jgi:hypothetical protein
MTDDDIDLLMKLANERPTPDKTPQDLRLEWVEQRIEWIHARLKWIDDFEKKAIQKGMKRDRDVMSRAA